MTASSESVEPLNLGGFRLLKLRCSSPALQFPPPCVACRSARDLECKQFVCFIDDGFGVYEIMDDDDQIEEGDEEFEDEVDVFASGLKRFDEPSAAVEEITKKSQPGNQGRT
ncbi:hypothetical protein Taro_014003 [Colocasia esculenta]|uniref:Uncharacterized protein n=1 Tax=Colocasia esculenta TaxID=4460 RepID=A0A843UDQ5_COLES|nr:hypothetical protein [Colocasia esculenta]